MCPGKQDQPWRSYLVKINLELYKNRGDNMFWLELEMGFDKDTNEMIIYDECSGSEIARISEGIDEDYIQYIEDNIDNIRITVPLVHIIQNGEKIRTERTQ